MCSRTLHQPRSAPRAPKPPSTRCSGSTTGGQPNAAGPASPNHRPGRPGRRQSRALPRSLSGGQRQRWRSPRPRGRARRADPDESTAALDVSIQAQVLNLLADIRDQTRVSYIVISHDLAVVRQLTDETVVLHHGMVVNAAPPRGSSTTPSTPALNGYAPACPGPAGDRDVWVDRHGPRLSPLRNERIPAGRARLPQIAGCPPARRRSWEPVIGRPGLPMRPRCRTRVRSPHREQRRQSVRARPPGRSPAARRRSRPWSRLPPPPGRRSIQADRRRPDGHRCP